MFLRRVVVGVLALVDLAAALHLSWLGINGFELLYPTARVLVDPILEGDLVFFEQPDVYSATPRETALAESARRRILESPPLLGQIVVLRLLLFFLGGKGEGVLRAFTSLNFT